MTALDNELYNLSKQLSAMQAKITQLERNQRSAQLGSSSIDGSSLTINDGQGNPQLVLGLQTDGYYTTQPVYTAHPPAVSSPIVQPIPAGLNVVWDGQMAGGIALPTNFAAVQVHMSLTNGFTPSTATLQGTLTTSGTFPINGLVPGTTYYIVFLLQDEAGNTGDMSSQVFGIAAVLPSAYISALTASMLGHLGVLNFNPYYWGGDITGWGAAGGSIAVTSSPPAGSPFTYALAFTPSVITNYAFENDLVPSGIPIQPNTQYLVTTWIYTPDTQVIFGFAWRNSAGIDQSYSAPAFNVTPNTWTPLTTVQTSPASGSVGAVPLWRNVNTTATSYAQATLMLPQVPGALVQAGTITALQIAAATIDVTRLAAGIIYAGIVDATTIQAATLIGSTILGYANSVKRGQYFESFESGTGSWTISNGTGSLAQDSSWASDGANSLKFSVTNTGVALASSPLQACKPFDPVAVSVDIFNNGTGTLAGAGCEVYYADSGFGYIGSDFTPVGNGINQLSLPAGSNATVTAQGITPSNAAYYGVKYGDYDGSGVVGRIINGDDVMGSGNLAFSAAAFPGTDSVGIGYDQGIEIKGIPGLTQAVSVQDPWGGASLATIDSGGNMSGQTISAAADVNLTGQSLTNDVLPQFAQGIINMGFTPGTFGTPSLWPSTAIGATETAIIEVDAQLLAGRAYRVIAVSTLMKGSSTTASYGQRIRYTTDGSTPTTSSAELTSCNWSVAASNFIGATAPMEIVVVPTVDALYSFLVTSNVSGGTFQYDLPLVLYVEDIGNATPANSGQNGTIFGTGTSGSPSKRTYTKTYSASHTYTYQGSDGHNPNTRMNTDGSATQGGDFSDTFNGKAKTWIRFPNATIASDLSGATINSVKLKLANQHSWYNSGMTVALGWDTTATFGSTKADPSGGNVDIKEYHINEGQTLTATIGNVFGTAFQSGGATSLVLFRNTNNLAYYGYFAGGNHPQLIISYTK
jgi:hypothetical protein